MTIYSIIMGNVCKSSLVRFRRYLVNSNDQNGLVSVFWHIDIIVFPNIMVTRLKGTCSFTIIPDIVLLFSYDLILFRIIFYL